jgi:hypothetical protein
VPDVAPDVEPVVPPDEPLPLAPPLGAVVPVVAPAVPALPVGTELPVMPGVPLFDTPDPTPDVEPVEPVEPVDEPLLPFGFPGDVEHADRATTPANPTDALIHFIVIFALCLKKENGTPHKCLHPAF